MSIHQLLLTADRPGSGDEGDRAVGGDGKFGADALAESRSAILTEGHGIGRGRALAAEEWGPVVAEVAEQRWYIDGARLDMEQTGVAEESS
jgi:hypothetical protein